MRKALKPLHEEMNDIKKANDKWLAKNPNKRKKSSDALRRLMQRQVAMHLQRKKMQQQGYDEWL